jgi:signal transduction histidine kinase
LLIVGLTDGFIGHGIWLLVALGVLTWFATTERTPLAIAGVIRWLAGSIACELVRTPGNLWLVVGVILVTATASLLTTDRRTAAVAAAQTTQRLSAEHAQASEQAVRAERLTVARELHDVASHAVVVMVVQAGAAEALLPTDPAAAARAIDIIDSTAITTLNELDQLLAVVDLDATDTQRLDGDDLRALIERMRGGGLHVEYDCRIEPEANPSPLVYRIVQETLTNALRHAPGANVRVLITVDPGHTTVEVTDDGPGPQSGTCRGYGLIGLSERVEHAGGSVEAGPGPSGTGFRVSAWLPSRVEAHP